MKKIIPLVALFVGFVLIYAPVAQAALTEDEDNVIQIGVREAQVDLGALANNYNAYNLLLTKIALELNVLRVQLSTGQVSTEQASVVLVNVGTEISGAVLLKANIENQLSLLITKVNTLRLNLIAYTNS